MTNQLLAELEALQQAKDKLQNDYQEAVDKINDLQQKIDKAIEYIKSEKYFDDIEVMRLIDKYDNILLEILGDK